MATGISIFETVKDQADKVLAGLDLPPVIKSITTDLGEDESGNDALFIHLHLTKEDLKNTDVRFLADFSERVQLLLIRKGISYFPYVFLDEVA